jgi:hypothetical protein
MKRIVLCISFIVVTLFSFAQSPFQFNFQAVARDLAGNPLLNQDVDFRLSLLQGSSMGAAVFVEDHNVQTNNFGLANLLVGTGTAITGTLDAVDWANGPYFLNIELDINDGQGLQFMGVSPMASVPFALHALTSEQAGPQGEPGVGITMVEILGDSLFTTLGDGSVFSSSISSLGSASVSTGVKLGYSESESWVCPDGITQISIEIWGGGGGSGSSSGYSLYSPGTSCFISADGSPCSPTIQGWGAPGGKGGNGGYTKVSVNVVPGESYDITVGNGGAGGAGGFGVGVNSGTFGGDGEPSTFLYAGAVLGEADGGFGGGFGTVACCPWPSQSSCPGEEAGADGTDGDIQNYTPASSIPDARSYIPEDYLTPTPGCCALGGTIGGLNSFGWLNHSGFGSTAAGSCNSGGACINVNNCSGDDVEVSPFPGVQGESGFVVITY